MTTAAHRRRKPPPGDPLDPSDLVAPQSEKACLAGLADIIDRDLESFDEIVSGLSADMFVAEQTAAVFAAIIEARNATSSPTMADIAAALRRQAAAAGIDYDDDPARQLLGTLASRTVGTGPQAARLAAEAAAEVRETALRRRAILAAGDAVARVRNGMATPQEIRDLGRRIDTLADLMDGRRTDGRELVVVMADKVEPQPIEWVWPQRISAGSLTLVAGYVGQAKSLLCLYMIGEITNGGRWPDASGTTRQGSAIWLGGEDGLERAFIKRVAAAGIDKTRLAIVKGTRARGETGAAGIVNLQRDVRLLLQQLDAMPDCRVIVFDPLSDYLGCDPNKREEVRPALQPLIEACNARNVAIVGIMHLSKKNDAVGVQRLAGSTAFSELARHILVVGNDPQDDDRGLNRRRIMLVSKNSYGPTDCGQAFRVMSRSDDIERPHLEWIPGGVEGMDCDTLLAKPKPPGGAYHQERRGDAVDALRKLLAAGERPGTEIEAELKAGGFGRRQIDHAVETLGIVRHWSTDGGRRASVWSLPQSDAAEPADPRVGTFTAETWSPF